MTKSEILSSPAGLIRLTGPISERTIPPSVVRLLTVGLFATGMAWVESAVVFYLRTMIDRIEPYQPNPLPIVGGFGAVEAVRELATMIMLFAVGVLAGRNWRARWGYFAVAFGIWDIFYYVFLWVISGWPGSLMDWDILFLLPLPWWGPVLAPVLIALLMIVWGTLASQATSFEVRGTWKPWLINVFGVLLALYVFMADSIRVVVGGIDAFRTLLPTHFNWPLFSLSLLLLAAPLFDLLLRVRFPLFKTNFNQAASK